MRLTPFALLSLLLTASAAHAAKAPLTGSALPGATVTFTTDAFGYLVCDPDELTATDPADKTKTLPPARWCSGQILSIHELSMPVTQSVGLGDAAELPLTKSFIDSTNLNLFDPTQDTVTSSTRDSQFRVATKGLLAGLLVILSQKVIGTRLVQVYHIINDGALPLSLRVDAVVDGDIDTGLGSNQNYGIHDARWPGAALAGSVSATISDSTRLIGVTLAMQGGILGGYRTLRAAAPGYELYRVPALGGYYDPAFLNGLFTFPAAAFGNGVNRPFTDEIPDDVNADGISDAAGDIVIGLQTKFGLSPGSATDITLTTTLASGGPYLDASICPLASVKINQSVDVALGATSVFGAPTYSISAGALPAGLALVNGHIVGKPTAGGVANFDVTVTDERMRKDTVACSISVTGCAVDCAVPAPCQAASTCDEATNTCVSKALPDGSPCSGGQCLAGACQMDASGSAGSTGSASTAGVTGSAGTGSAGTGSASMGASGGVTSGPEGSGGAGSGGAGNGAFSPAGGCGCEVGSRAGGGAGWALFGLVLLAARRRTRARCADHNCW